MFLARADLGMLVEAENDWHRNAGQHTAPLPRITADMTAPPAAGKVSRAWVETLFRLRRDGRCATSSTSESSSQMSRKVSMLAPSSLRRSARSS